MINNDEWDLAISEDGGVVALEAALDEVADARVVDVHLTVVHVEDVVVGEGLVGAEDHLRFGRRDRRARPAHVDHFPRWLRPDPINAKSINSIGIDAIQVRSSLLFHFFFYDFFFWSIKSILIHPIQVRSLLFF